VERSHQPVMPGSTLIDRWRPRQSLPTWTISSRNASNVNLCEAELQTVCQNAIKILAEDRRAMATPACLSIVGNIQGQFCDCREWPSPASGGETTYPLGSA
jgi:hypothetical protein